MRRRSILTAAVLCGLLCFSNSLAEAAPLLGGNASRYQGNWSSNTNGHQGRLAARVSQQNASTYRVRYRGTFLGVVPFTYSVPMTVTGQYPDGSTALYGESRLPLFGQFSSHARMNGQNFSATYSSRRDQGQFNMQRR